MEEAARRAHDADKARADLAAADERTRNEALDRRIDEASGEVDRYSRQARALQSVADKLAMAADERTHARLKVCLVFRGTPLAGMVYAASFLTSF